jgi:hypothetical protein
LLSKRLNDFKTEGEYIAKILNRNINEEFVAQMKRELKNLVNVLNSSNSFDQTTASFPDCDEFSSTLNGIERESNSLQVSANIEKLLCIVNKCHLEICTKIYQNDAQNQSVFVSFCVELIWSHFKRKSSIDGSKKQLPQFASILLNDLTYATLFIKLKLKSKRTGLFESLRKQLYSAFVDEQGNEIHNLFDSFDNLAKSIKKISLFFSRLENVLKPIMLRTDLVNLQLFLLNHTQELGWKHLKSLTDIDQDEIGFLKQFCADLIGLEDKIIAKYGISSIKVDFLKFHSKLEDFKTILDDSLIHIINSYHRSEYRLKDSELAGFVKAIFASSPLRNEFIKELSLNIQEINNDFY